MITALANPAGTKMWSILVASSNPVFSRGVADLLPPGFGRVDVAKGGAEALAKLEKHGHQAALLDCRLADLDSRELLVLIAAQYPELNVLLVDSENGLVLNTLAATEQASKEPQPIVDMLLDALSAWHTGQHGQPSLETPGALIAPLPGMIGHSPKMQEVYRLARLVAARRTSVLLTGETGTGKELVARAIHQISPRAASPMVTVNCAAIPEELLEAELFGFARGAFTGAVQARWGRLHSANGGVLFLDEVGELPQGLQVKLLRFLQDGEVQRLGCQETQHLDVRVIAATSTRLAEKVAAHQFREDLYYRLAVFPCELPPLRERREDIEPIATNFLEGLVREYHLPSQWLCPAACDLLREYSWPGNVRELQHAIERASILADGTLELRPEHFSLPGCPKPRPKIRTTRSRKGRS